MDESFDIAQDKLYWLAFSICNGIGPIKFKKLLQHFGSARDAWEASLAELEQSGIGQKMAENVDAYRKTAPLESYLERMKKSGAWFVTMQEPLYPELLKGATNPPFILYGKGNKACLQNDLTTLADVRTLLSLMELKRYIQTSEARFFLTTDD